MDFFKIVLISLVCAVLIVVVRQFKPEFTTPLTVGASVMLLLFICDALFDVVYTFYGFAESSGIDKDAVSCVIKVVGIGYLAEFSNNVCVDANCKSIGDKVLLASKIAIIYCALPVVQRLFELLRGLVA